MSILNIRLHPGSIRLQNFFAFTILSVALFAVLGGCHRMDDPDKEKNWQGLLDKKEFFQLRWRLRSDTAGVAPDKKLYFLAFVDNAFNHNEASNADIDTLFSQYGGGLKDSAKARLIRLKADNYFKTFQYAKAAEADRQLTGTYRAVLDSFIYDDIKNRTLIDSGLSGVLPQTTTIARDVSVSWVKDKVGLIEVPVKTNDSAVWAVFDTRANLSSISASYAKKMGIRLLHVSYKEGSGATGNSFESALGIADSLRLGDVLLRNVVFQVMPDEVLYIAPVDFRMNVIIGYPVIAQLREVHIRRDGNLLIPAVPEGSSLRNMAMDELNPVISCVVGADSLLFNFDTGASSSDFFDTFYKRFEAQVRGKAKEDSVMVGGAGGVIKQKIFALRNVRLKVGSQYAILPKVSVHSEPIPHVTEVFYGNLGQDLMSQFNETILNFQDMFIDFK